MNCLVSIVVPIYKVEAYLDRCVESLVKQTYTNIEILLIDDGSPDRCGEMCDAWAAADSRIHAYHKLNGGLSDARNYGTERAAGEYITYVDSDDFISCRYIERLLTLCLEQNADIGCCCFTNTESDEADFTSDQDIEVLTRHGACEALMGRLYMPLVIACCKLYKRDIVKNNPFPVGKIHEDEATTCKFLYNAEATVVCQDKLYAYYPNPNSITRAAFRNYDAVMWALEERARYFEQQGETELANSAWTIVVKYLMDAFVIGNVARQTAIKYIRSNRLFGRVSLKARLKVVLAMLLPSVLRKKKETTVC